VTTYAARRRARPADMADLVAATFLALVKDGSSCDPSRGEFRPWLLGTAHRQLGPLRHVSTTNGRSNAQ
jgi:DNA-directed RNA polymerase specialized sigma24 family protein